MLDQIAKIGLDGRILIPASYRRELHFEPGAALVLTIENDRLQIVALKEVAKRAQASVKKHSKKQSLTALLKQERKEDLSHE